nr:MAG TPA: hypothetical protein [Caudoviricetes sp.]DAX94518.1 MAG TPA: hypothetical protein [Caudoviricetes sp.]
MIFILIVRVLLPDFRNYVENLKNIQKAADFFAMEGIVYSPF